MGRTKSRGNGQGTAYKRGRSWTAEIMIGWAPNPDPTKPNIRIRRTKGGFATKKEALEYCPILAAGGAVKPAFAPRLSAYWETYKAGEYKRLSSSKQTAYRIAWNRLKTLHDMRVDAITVDILRGAVSATCETYYPARDCRSLLTNLFNLAGADGYANRDLPSYIVLPPLHEKERVFFAA